MITAPYNFVPLNKEVFYPEWSEQVSHDVPFSDGESGVIEVEIEAVSPIFIRDSKNKEEFCSHEGKCYIPGSSLKGNIRSILETMSFAKLSEDLLNDSTYSFRDLNSKNKALYMNEMKPEKIFCGWLKSASTGYVIEDCGLPGRVRHEEIDKMLGMQFAKNFKAGVFKNEAKSKTAEYKYSFLKDKNLTSQFKFLKKDVMRDIYQHDANGGKIGTIVFTGQPSSRKEQAPNNPKASGKIYEFIFFTPTSEKLPLSVPKDALEKFKFAYFDERETEPKESPDWKYWKKKLNLGEKVPIFFKKNSKGDIESFGLSYLFKLPYKYSVIDGVPESHKDSRLDLAQTVFGYVSKDMALKSRVVFSHLSVINQPIKLPVVSEILGTPQASYYPMYVEQNGRIYSTYMDNDFQLAGRKRYPIHKNNIPRKTTDTGNKEVTTRFAPLKEGVKFKGKIIYHNLKKTELGALISALTFHNTPNTFHNIGMAKSLGYGKIKIKILSNIQTEECMGEFEKTMKAKFSDWLQSPQITELLTMSSEQSNRDSSDLRYMDLPDFANAKRDTEYLKPYSKLDGINKLVAKSIVLSSRPVDTNSSSETKPSIILVDNKPKIQQQKPKSTNETWQERMIRMAKSNPASPIQNILNDLNNKPTVYIDHEKDVARALMEQMKKAGKWQEEIPKIGNHDNYKLTQKVKKYLE